MSSTCLTHVQHMRNTCYVTDTCTSGDLGMFKLVLSRGQAAEGRRVIQALERLKLPDESSMARARGHRLTACRRCAPRALTDLRVSIGRVLMRHVVRRSDLRRPSAFAVGMLRDVREKKIRARLLVSWHAGTRIRRRSSTGCAIVQK